MDGLTQEKLQLSAKFLASPLMNIIANPLLKKGAKDDKTNYRPVSRDSGNDFRFPDIALRE